MSDPAELAVPLALGIPSLLLLIAVCLLPRRNNSYQPLAQPSAPSRWSEARHWALLLASVGLAVTCFYTLATQIALSHPEEHPLDLLTIQSIQFTAERAKTPALAADLQTVFSRNSNEFLALANATHSVAAGLEAVAALVIPSPLEIPSLPDPNSVDSEAETRIATDSALDNAIDSIHLPPTTPFDPLSVSPIDLNQTSYITELNGKRLGVSTSLSQFLGATRAYNSYDGNSTIRAPWFSQAWAQLETTSTNTLGRIIVSGPGDFGYELDEFFANLDIIIDSQARVFFSNVLFTAYGFHQLRRDEPTYGLKFPSFCLVYSPYPEPFYPKGLYDGFVQLTDNLGGHRAGEPDTIDSPSIFQFDCYGRKIAYFMGPMIIDPSLSSPTIASDTIQAENVTVNDTLIYKTLVTTSDARYKFDIESLKRRFYADLMKPVTFEWETDHEPATGFIAQDIEKELPPCEHKNGLDTVCILAYQFASMRALSDRITVMNQHTETLGLAVRNRLEAMKKGIGVRIVDRLGYKNVQHYIDKFAK